MGFPGWFGLFMIPMLLILVIMRGRFLKEMWRRMKDGRIDPDDEWDPFQ